MTRLEQLNAQIAGYAGESIDDRMRFAERLAETLAAEVDELRRRLDERDAVLSRLASSATQPLAGIAHHVMSENRLKAERDQARAERDEIQRRLDAVVAMLEPDGPPIPGGLADKENRFYWRYGKHLHARAVAIAEGRDNG